jgi:hypothetical protein
MFTRALGLTQIQRAFFVGRSALSTLSRRSIWEERKPNHVDDLDKSGHDGEGRQSVVQKSALTSARVPRLTAPAHIGSYVSKKWIWTAKARGSEEA